MKVKLGWLLPLLVGCKPEAGPPPADMATSARASASASAEASASAALSDKDLAEIVAFFADVGDRTAAAIEKVTAAKPKSKIAYAEALFLATPAAYPVHADLFEKHGIKLDRLRLAMGDPDLQKRALAPLQAKLESVMSALASKDLPETDPEDCTALARRVVELRQQGPSKAAVARALAPMFAQCATVVPKHVAACLPSPTKSSTLEEFDACVAAGQPAKKP